MNPSSHKPQDMAKIFRYISSVLLFLLTLSCIISFTSGYESETRYFQISWVNLPLAAIAILSLLSAISTAIIFKGCDTAPHANINLRLISILPTIAIIRAMIHVAVKEISSLFEAAELGRSATFDTWAPLLLLTAIFAVIYNLLEIFPINRILKLICGALQIIFCIVLIANLYIDFSVELNSPAKLLLQFSAAAIIIYTLAGIRRELKIPNAPLLLASSLITAGMGIANAVALFAEFIPNADKYNNDYSVYPIIFIAFGIKATVDLFTCSIFKAEQEKEATTPENAEAEESTGAEADNLPHISHTEEDISNEANGEDSSEDEADE